jgi:succinate dehydrogenase/fumarate reductase flavoprotein subunit
LNDYFPDMGKLATAIFLKGYEWPFDPEKIQNYGSSLIDLLVYQETVVKGRRACLDFTRNPSGGGKLEEFSWSLVSREASSYLEKSGALLPTPIQRLAKMNPPAMAIYKNNGIDLCKEPLEISLCAQHNNGGFKGNIWWESNIKHLFPVGEVNGSHGVTRPGGSALNSGQVGSLRAALFIARRYNNNPPSLKTFLESADTQVKDKLVLAEKMLDRNLKDSAFIERSRQEVRERMSSSGAAIRTPEKVKRAGEEAWTLYERLKSEAKVRSAKELPAAFRVLDLCLTHALYLEAIQEYLEKGGKSRGSYLVLDPKGSEPCPGMGGAWRFSLNAPKSFVDRKILEISLDNRGKVVKTWVDIRPIPQEETWFENVWNDYREDRIIREEDEP